jgi:hypothetical protein
MEAGSRLTSASLWVPECALHSSQLTDLYFKYFGKRGKWSPQAFALKHALPYVLVGEGQSVSWVFTVDPGCVAILQCEQQADNRASKALLTSLDFWVSGGVQWDQRIL